MSSEQALQQAQAERLTLRVADSPTGYLCVHLSKPGHPKPYQAQVKRGGKNVHLGYFVTVEEAALCIARSQEGQAAAAAAAAAAERELQRVQAEEAAAERALVQQVQAEEAAASALAAVDHGLDSLWENDMLESVPVAPGEQSLCQQVAAARALRALELSHKRKQTAVPCP